MSYHDDPNEILMGGGIPAATFPAKGTVVKGVIHRVASKQQTDFATRAPLFYENGDPKMQLIITLQTDLRDPETPNDDGKRKLYVKGQMIQAVREAVIAARAEGLEDGGTLAVQWNDETPSNKGNPQKLYVAQYVAPQRGGDLLGVGNGQQAQQSPAAQWPANPPQQQAPQPSLLGQQTAPAADAGAVTSPAPTTGANLI